MFIYEHLLYQDNYIIEEIKNFNTEKDYKVNSLQQFKTYEKEDLYREMICPVEVFL